MQIGVAFQTWKKKCITNLKKKKVSKKEKANANSISAPQFSVSGKIRREQGYSERVWRKARIQYPCT